jgi:hypothetical protein
MKRRRLRLQTKDSSPHTSNILGTEEQKVSASYVILIRQTEFRLRLACLLLILEADMQEQAHVCLGRPLPILLPYA